MNRRAWLWAAALGTTVQAEEAPDLSILRRYLRSLGAAEEPQAVPKEALERLEKSGPAWKAVRAFLEATAAENAQRRSEVLLTRRMLTEEERVAKHFAQWEMRASALMELARAGKLADDVYQEARRSLEEELKKGLSGLAGKEKPFPRTVDEASALILGILEPELKDPKDLPEALRKEVAGLLAKLGDPSFDAREAATKRLLEIGEPALGALRPALDHPDPEVKERVRGIWRRILGGTP